LLQQILSTIILTFFCATAFAQNQEAGQESIFSYGVGARALGLGGAFIAAPNDASAVYWNPGGLDHLERKSATMFYSNLPFGGQYNFIGYAHPTMSFGTFGAAVLRVGIDFDNNDANGVLLGQGDLAHTQFLFSYGKQLPLNFSAGLSIKIEQQSFSLANGTATGRGIGADFGLIYQPQFDMELLQNTSVGVIIQNAVPPIIKTGETNESIPRSYKFGLAKTLRLGAREDHISFYGDLEYAVNKTPKFHFGAEYAYQGMAMLRAGFTDNEIVFGAGASVGQFELDYSYGKFAKSVLLDASHRISISIEFGPTKAEMIEQELRRRDQEIADRVNFETRLRNQVEIQNNLDAANTLFQQGKYFDALIRYNAAQQLDPNNDAAIRGAQLAESKVEEENRKREEERLKQKTADLNAARIKDYVDTQLKKGISFFNAGQYDRAITEWEKALSEDPQNPTVQNWIAKTQQAIKAQISVILRDADRFSAQGKYLEALDNYKEVQRTKQLDDATRNKVDTEIAILQNRMNRDDAYQKGIAEYFKKNYADALEYFDQALRLDPNNKQLQDYWERADARANARDEPFANDYIKNQYRKAADLVFRKKYKDALDILLEIQAQQKYSRDILKLIDEVEEAMNRQ
jgi:tetratricopeptide (TPR) repeat protein